jgi:hypothetical protein
LPQDPNYEKSEGGQPERIEIMDGELWMEATATAVRARSEPQVHAACGITFKSLHVPTSTAFDFLTYINKLVPPPVC